MKILIYFTLFISILACQNASKNTSKDDAHLLKIVEPKITLSLPEETITKKEIDELVSEIDKLILNGNLKLQRVYGFDDRPCEILKYFQDSLLVQMEFGCGDCTSFMSTEKYYFNGNDLIFADKNYIHYGYNPCWTDSICKENGITEIFKKNNLKTRNEKYYFLNMGFIFSRTGNFNNPKYLKNDTLSVMEVLDDAIKYANAKNE